MSVETATVAAAKDLMARFSEATGADLRPESPINLHEPIFDSLDLEEVSDAIESGYVSSVGSHVTRFAAALSEFTSVPYAVPLVNGTSALQLALHLASVGRGDEVAVPALSFVATANAVKFLGADPVFVDSTNIGKDKSLGMDVESLEELLSHYHVESEQYVNKKTGSRLAAIVPVHTLGRIANTARLRGVLECPVPIIEDAAEALGSFSNGDHPGINSDAVLSFNGNKVITTGGGGAFLTSSEARADRARSLSSTAKLHHSWRFSHSEVGWNFRMPALNAALGVSQMRKLPRFLSIKRELAQRYKDAFVDSEFFEFIDNPPGQEPNNWLNALRSRSAEISGVLDLVTDAGLMCRPMWDLLPSLDPYGGSFTMRLTNASQIRDEVICLPSSVTLLTR